MKSMKKLVLVAFVLLASVMVLLPLVGCDTNAGDTPSNNAETTQQPSGDGSGKTEPPKYTVTFNTDGGSAVDSQSVESGKMANKPEDPSLEGSWFLGWYGDKELTKEFDFTSPITNNTEVYAKWSYKFHAKPQILTEYTSPNNTDDTWTYVAFGDWPQTIKAGDVTVDETKSRTMGMFTYYLGSDGNYYLKEKEDAHGSWDQYKYSDRTQAGQGGTSEKWFKVEPIVWRVLTDNYLVPGENGTKIASGNALLLAENILTGGIPYYVDKITRTITGEGTKEEESDTVYPNNYKYSTIRAWLNGSYETDDTQEKNYEGKGFLQTAFTDEALKCIAETTVDNTARSTNPDSNASQLNGGDNPYACGNTEDKIFLLSEQEASTEEYGFAAYDALGEDNTRIRVTTDYAKATGPAQDSTAGYGGWWWLRSPQYSYDYRVYDIYSHGYAADFSDVDFNKLELGVVPALSISLQ